MTHFQELDFYGLDQLLEEEERMVRDQVRQFVDERILPIVGEHYEAGSFPHHLEREMGQMGMLGPTVPECYGGAGLSSIAYGLISQELERGDSGIRSFASVQGSLVMFPIYQYGSEEQKKTWLPVLASAEKVGCFGLTEPDFGSNPGGMRTRCRRNGDEWILDGRKMWITNGTGSDLAVVWAKDEEGVVRGFLVETDRPGFSAPEQKHKWSFRCSVTSELVLDQVKVPDRNRLPGAKGLKGPLSCLTQARYGIAWGALGAAQACFDEARRYCLERQVFDKPLAGYQLTQEKLAEIATEITKGQLLVWRLGKLKDQGTMTPEQVSMAKRNNVFMALQAARQCRSLLGANGISLEFHTGRHLCNLETVLTYEGTHEVHTLILGQAVTGIPAYR
ncbi:MAG: acyl-CoA dehydrogenase [Planctomycetota bacterium]|nr:MAG: acyl-CoA dehydrogenase [Planctomycetota bacterium]